MDLLAPGKPLEAIRGSARIAITDYRAPLSSPITLIVLLAKACGFRWWGAEKIQPDGSTATTCFLDTTIKHDDGSEIRRITWAFRAGDRVDVAGDPVSLVQLTHFFGSCRVIPEQPLPRGAREVFQAMLGASPSLWTQEMPFNARGKLLLATAATIPNREAQLILADLIELYRGFCWKLSTPADHPPHPTYGYPLDRHLRYRRGRRTGDVRRSICLDERMEELRQFSLR